jgi:hypothetical protein
MNIGEKENLHTVKVAQLDPPIKNPPPRWALLAKASLIEKAHDFHPANRAKLVAPLVADRDHPSSLGLQKTGPQCILLELFLLTQKVHSLESLLVSGLSLGLAVLLLLLRV